MDSKSAAVSRRRVSTTKKYRRKLRNVRKDAFRTGQNYNYKYKVGLGEFKCFNASAVAGIAFSPTLNNLPNYAEFQALYDSYSIKKVVYHFYSRSIPSSDVSSSAAPWPLNQMPTLVCVDHDDANAPTARQQLLERTATRIHDPRKNFSVTIVPKIANVVYRGTATPDGYSTPKGNQWLDCAYSDIPHYGLKVVGGFDAVCTRDTVMYDIYATYYISFKGTL